LKKRTPLALICAFLAAIFCGGSGAVGGAARRLTGHVPVSSRVESRRLERHDGADRIRLAIALRPRDLSGLVDLVEGLYDPADPRFHQFLTSAEFRERFAPTDEDVAAVAKYFGEHGLKVSGVSGGNLLLNVEGNAAMVEETFRVELHDYAGPDGRRAYEPNAEPLVQDEAAERVTAVIGLSSSPKFRPHLRELKALDARALVSNASINDYMTPSKLRAAYNVDAVPKTGSGETLALFELDGYLASDVTAYATQFGLTVPPLQNVYVSDGVSTPTGTAGAGTTEVILDIEVAMATAPGLSKIMVYEGVNSAQGVLNTYAAIANDNLAKEVSTSWGLAEANTSPSFRSSENTIFLQMASQGQSLFAASGDNGAYDNGTSLSVDDPASQPYVTAVGGTTLSANTSGAYIAEASWGTTSNRTGGGGGVSSVWTQPSYQAGLATTANQACPYSWSCTTMRMVPDVSLDANPSTGYPIYVTVPGHAGGWTIVGGTSAAAPIWAAFMAIVNQGRVASALSRVGFANNALYKIAQSNLYANAFHDVADFSTNLYYQAVTGYDLTTGLGSIKGAGLYNALVNASYPPYPPASILLTSAPASLTVSWGASSDAASYKVYRSATGLAGSYSAISTGIATLSYVDTTAAGVNFYYVTAVNSAGESSASRVESGAINQTAPNMPSSFSISVIK
jgi:subtilase family serine protease